MISIVRQAYTEYIVFIDCKLIYILTSECVEPPSV